MPIPTPFYSKTSALCQSHEWRDWSGYLVPATYEPTHEHEYFSVRNAAALFDVSPLFKYEVTGPEAARLVNRIVTRDVSKSKIGQIVYTPWCDEDGKVIDDGTVWRLEQNRFRITSADPNLRWFQDVGYGMQAQVEDVSISLAALALQGPKSREILKALEIRADLDNLKYYWLTETEFQGHPLTITRTGYTGDLGFELWIAPEGAGRLWEALMERGRGYGLTPAGLVALDMARIEAGLLLIEVDYISARQAVIESQKSSPFDIGLGWTVALDKGDFIGKKALLEEKSRGARWKFVGLEIEWESLERLFGEVDLPPQVAGRASRSSLPVYRDGRQVGQVTSSVFSPLLKKYIGIGTLEKGHAATGTQVEVETTVEYSRERASATVVKLPFVDPDRKRALGHA